MLVDGERFVLIEPGATRRHSGTGAPIERAARAGGRGQNFALAFGGGHQGSARGRDAFGDTGFWRGQRAAGCARQITPQEAWKTGELNADDIAFFLESLDVWGGFGWDKDDDLRHQMAALLAEHEGALMARPQQFSPVVHLWVAEYFSSLQDERALTLTQSIVEQMPETLPDGAPPGQLPLAFQALQLRARFYQSRGQFDQSEAPWKRILVLLPAQGWWHPYAQIEAARVARQAGRTEEALQLYMEAGRDAVELHSMGAILESLGRQLRTHPQQTETRLLQLEKEVTNPAAQLVTQFLLAWARYTAGDWDAFLLQSERRLARYQAFDDRSSRQLFAPSALALEDAQNWARRWQTNAIVAENPDLKLVFDGPLEQPVQRRIFVNTAVSRALEVSVEGDSARVQAHLENSPCAPDLETTRHQQIVLITIAPGAAQVQATIRVEFAGRKDKFLRLPLQVSTGKAEDVTP